MKSSAPPGLPPQQRLRLRYAKRGDLRWLGHLDLLRTWERWLRRSGAQIALSGGFRPKPRLVFPAALAVGVTGLDEVLELHLAQRQPPAQLQVALQQSAPPGLDVLSIVEIPLQAPRIRVRSYTLHLGVPADRLAAAAARALELLSAAELTVERDGQTRSVRDCLLQAERTAGGMCVELKETATGGLRVSELLQLLGLEDLEPAVCPLTRTRVELHSPALAAVAQHAPETAPRESIEHEAGNAD